MSPILYHDSTFAAERDQLFSSESAHNELRIDTYLYQIYNVHQSAYYFVVNISALYIRKDNHMAWVNYNSQITIRMYMISYKLSFGLSL